MALVTGDDERQSPDRALIVVSHAATVPGFFVQVAEQRNGRAANVFVFISQVAQASLVEFPSENVVVLLKTSQRRRVAAGEPQRSIGKDSLAVDHVANNFFDAPFPVRVAIRFFVLRNALDQSQHIVKLPAKRRDDVSIGDARNVTLSVCWVLPLL